ncbi:hypothetical protein JCM6882_002412 [Rhodosporidiobolus microsporus]
MVRLASLAVLTAAAGTALAVGAYPAHSALAARSLDRRGLLDWLGFGDDDDKSEKEAYLETVDWSDPVEVGIAGMAVVIFDAKEAKANNTVCSDKCMTFYNTTYACSQTSNTTDDGGLSCYCGSDSTSQLQTCSSCVGNDSMAAAKNFTGMCEQAGYKVDDSAASALLAQGGIAAALLAGGLALLF